MSFHGYLLFVQSCCIISRDCTHDLQQSWVLVTAFWARCSDDNEITGPHHHNPELDKTKHHSGLKTGLTCMYSCILKDCKQCRLSSRYREMQEST